MRPRRPISLLLLGLTLTVAGLVPPASPAAAGTPAPAAGTPSTAGTTLAGHPCRLLQVAAPTAGSRVVAPLSCPGVRPGAAIVSPIGLCTLNFLFQGSDGSDYIGTAGHCLLEGSDVRQAVFGPGTGPLALDGAGARIGTFAYAALDNERDFSLIRLDPGVSASPEACGFGGPTSLDTGPIPPLTSLHYVAQGSFTGDLAPARTQLTLSEDALSVTSLGLASPGDSGGPVVRADGRAAGILVATGPGLPLALLGAGVVSYTMKLAPQVDLASRATGIAYTLKTAPLRQALL
ncbi:MAG: hypothetical protein QOD63_2378 [Actinomycetota bacterium]|nr:hypothetical protein [Actinomycetota bacterium]